MDKRFKIKVTIRKEGIMRYFSQLDLVRILERALRRTQLPIFFTQGFNSRAKMSFNKALKLGEKGEIEVIFYFRERVDKELLRIKLSKNLPKGIRLRNIEIVNG